MKRLVLAALCAVLALAPLRGQTPELQKAVEAKLQQPRDTIAYLQKLQMSDGGFLPAAPGPKDERPVSSLRATSSALRALKYFGGEPKDKAAASRFVETCFDKSSGGFADRPGGKPDVFTSAIGIMAAMELKLATDTYAPAVLKYLGDNAKTFDEVRIAAAGVEAIGKKPAQAEAWLEMVKKMRNADGTFGKGDGLGRDTGGAVVVLLRLAGKIDHADKVISMLNSCQRTDGGFGKEGAKESDLETSYRVMRAYWMLKDKPAGADNLRAFVAKCRNSDGGYGVAPGQPSTVSGTYFASIILHWLGEK
jgi:prenyltransferase beta subunit